MKVLTICLLSFSFASSSWGIAIRSGEPQSFPSHTNSVNVTQTCIAIQKAVSSKTIVSYPGSDLYVKDNFHWFSSGDEISACSVEPASPQDLSKIVKIIGSTRTPFNVKGAGAATNPGESSSPGIQIAMYQFDTINYNKNNATVDLGLGLTFDQVYAELAKVGQNVLGGRLPTVGVAGFVLGGGGYTWLSNQHGLTIDTVQSFDMVLPGGEITHVTAVEHPDLFFAVKGGYNNFGIVYQVTLKTFPQGLVWGGILIFPQPQIAQATAAVASFSANNTDPKAQLIGIYSWTPTGNTLILGLFYDGPTPPKGPFDEILNVTAAVSNVQGSNTFANFVQSLGSNVTNFTAVEPRVLQHGVSLLHWSPSILTQFANQSAFYAETAAEHGITTLQWSTEPFLPNYFQHSQGGAYPHSPSFPLLPMSIQWEYNSTSEDKYVHDSILESAELILGQAVKEGQNVGGSKQIRYPNYALYDTPLEQLYGDNLPRLRAIKATYDPTNVMGLAGGFKI